MDVGLPRPVARRLRERLPRLRPAEGALRARRRLRRRGRLQGPEVGGRPLVQERPQRRWPGWPRRYCRTTSPRYGCRPPRSRGSGTSPGHHDAATARLAAAKQRLLAFLARRGYAYGGTTPAGNPRRYWTYDFLRWLDKVRPADDGGIRALAALRNEVEAAAETRDDLLAEYRAAVAAGPLSAEVEALQSIKGCGFALAAAFASEVGDFSRFRSGRQVTSYFGLAPKQRSSADSVRLGGISGAGDALVRRLAVEGSWSYVQASHQPKLMPKGSGVPLEVRMHGRKGSERLLRRREEMLARGMPQAKANAATAAELVRWLWALGAMCREATE